MEIISNGSLVTAQMAQLVVDRAIEDGHSRSALRWRCGWPQKRAMQNFVFVVADNAHLRRIAIDGWAETGQFVGIPYIVDPSVPAGEIRLEVIRETERVGAITGLAVPASEQR